MLLQYTFILNYQFHIFLFNVQRFKRKASYTKTMVTFKKTGRVDRICPLPGRMLNPNKQTRKLGMTCTCYMVDSSADNGRKPMFIKCEPNQWFAEMLFLCIDNWLDYCPGCTGLHLDSAYLHGTNARKAVKSNPAKSPQNKQTKILKHAHVHKIPLFQSHRTLTHKHGSSPSERPRKQINENP